MRPLLLLLCLAACNDDPPRPPHDPPDRPARPEVRATASVSASASAAPVAPATAPEPSAAPSATASADAKRDLEQECPEAEDDAPALKLVDFKLTTKIEDKKPTDEVSIVKAGTKVYAYLGIKNLTDVKRCVQVTFRVNGRLRSSLTLDIGKSPNWHTWAYVTANKDDAGAKIDIDVIDDQGREQGHAKVLVEP
jgi:hypothetical protein